MLISGITTMSKLYENKIINKGPMAEEFKGENMMILFGSKAPAELKDFCYIIDVVPVQGDIKPGHGLYVDGERFEITAVGDAVKQNLGNLGHITIRFDGSTTAELPGTLYIENKPMPAFGVGTELVISE